MSSVAAGEAETLVVAQMQGIFRTPGIAAQTIAAAARLDDTGDIAGREREIVAAILDGRQPRGLSVNAILKEVAAGWDRQREAWEFPGG